MKRNFLLGLVTTAALFFAAPVAAREIPHHTPIRSTRQDVEDIRAMRRASQARFEGDLSTIAPAPVPETAPVASAPEPAPAPAPVQAPAPEPAPAPAPVQAPAPEPAPAPAPEPAPAPAPALATVTAPEPETTVVPAPDPAPAPGSVPASSVKGTATEVIPPACLGKAYPHHSEGLAYQLNKYEHMVCLLATDEAWKLADQRRDYRLGADLERGVQPLSALEKHAPYLLPMALAILRGEENYT